MLAAAAMIPDLDRSGARIRVRIRVDRYIVYPDIAIDGHACIAKFQSHAYIWPYAWKLRELLALGLGLGLGPAVHVAPYASALPYIPLHCWFRARSVEGSCAMASTGRCS